MASINIGGQQDDIFHRYKMPQLKTRIDRKGGGAKTVLVNIAAVGKALHRPPICMLTTIVLRLLTELFFVSFY
jgi:hypothetical protein